MLALNWLVSPNNVNKELDWLKLTAYRITVMYVKAYLLIIFTLNTTYSEILHQLVFDHGRQKFCFRQSSLTFLLPLLHTSGAQLSLGGAHQWSTSPAMNSSPVRVHELGKLRRNIIATSIIWYRPSPPERRPMSTGNGSVPPSALISVKRHRNRRRGEQRSICLTELGTPLPVHNKETEDGENIAICLQPPALSNWLCQSLMKDKRIFLQTKYRFINTVRALDTHKSHLPGLRSHGLNWYWSDHNEWPNILSGYPCLFWTTGYTTLCFLFQYMLESDVH